MKKIVSLVLAVCLMATMFSSVTTTASAESSPVVTRHIDLAQETGAALISQVNNAGSITAAVADGKLVVDVANYNRQLSDNTPSKSNTWLPNFTLWENGAALALTNGNKAIFQVTYKVTNVTDAEHGTQIGIGTLNTANNNTIWMRVYKKHTAADIGKEFTLIYSYTVTNLYTKIAFSGGGQLEISDITVHELPAANINDYAVVKYVDGDSEICEFAEKNSAPQTPSDKEGYTFDGWYTDSDFTGDAVTAVSADATLYAKWKPFVSPIVTKQIDLMQDVNLALYGNINGNITTATSKDDKLVVDVKNDVRQLTAYNSNQAWYPNYLLMENDTPITLTTGTKVIVEVTYKVTGTPDATHGTQIGICFDNAALGSNVRVLGTYKKHTAADVGKEFTLSYAYTVGWKGIKIAFSGRGQLEISSITVRELSADEASYGLVTYTDGDSKTYEFAEKGSELPTPVKDGYTFEGWYTAEGEKVTDARDNLTVTAAWVKNDTVDLTKSVKVDGTKATLNIAAPEVSGEPLQVSIHGYEKLIFDGDTMRTTVIWGGGALVALKYASDEFVTLNNATKYLVNVNYDVTEVGTYDSLYHPQIAIAYNNHTSAGNTLTDNGQYALAAKKHDKVSAGETLSCIVSGKNSNSLRLLFDGQGKFNINSVTVTEISSAIKGIPAVQFMDKTNTFNKAVLAEKGDAVPVLPQNAAYNFGGWYNEDGTKVTEITEDAVLTAKWYDRADVTMDDRTDVKDLIRLKKVVAALTDDIIYDVNRDGNISSSDLAVLTKSLLGTEILTVNGNDISSYTVVSGDQTSFMTVRAAETLADSIHKTFGVNLAVNSAEAASANKIVVGITGIAEETLKTGALENLTGVNGDVYGLDDYKIFFKENDLYIEAGSDYAAAYAVNQLIDYLEIYRIIPAGFALAGKYNQTANLLNGYSYVWGDEFNSASLDTAKWSVATGKIDGPYHTTSDTYYKNTRWNGNWIDVPSSPRWQDDYIYLLNEEGNNYYLQDGLLVMNTKKLEKGYSGTKISAKKNFTYGIMTARVKLATKNGAASTLWSRSVDDIGGTGASVNEMDFVENFGADQIVPNLHTWTNYTNDTNHAKEIDKRDILYPASGESLSDAFHDIALYWTNEKIVFYFDGVPYLEQDISTDKAKWEAFHKSTYMIMGVSAPSGLYGTYNDGNMPGNILEGLIDTFNENFCVDYVRIYQK